MSVSGQQNPWLCIPTLQRNMRFNRAAHLSRQRRKPAHLRQCGRLCGAWPPPGWGTETRSWAGCSCRGQRSGPENLSPAPASRRCPPPASPAWEPPERLHARSTLISTSFSIMHTFDARKDARYTRQRERQEMRKGCLALHATRAYIQDFNLPCMTSACHNSRRVHAVHGELMCDASFDSCGCRGQERRVSRWQPKLPAYHQLPASQQRMMQSFCAHIGVLLLRHICTETA